MSDKIHSEHVDELLESLDASKAGVAVAPPPPAAFLRAVGRRRRNRIMTRAAASCVAMCVVVGLLIVSRPAVTPVPGPGHTTLVARVTVSDTSALALAIANRDVMPERLSLPDHPSTPMDLPLRAGERFDSGRMEEWLGQ